MFLLYNHPAWFSRPLHSLSHKHSHPLKRYIYCEFPVHTFLWKSGLMETTKTVCSLKMTAGIKMLRLSRCCGREVASQMPQALKGWPEAQRGAHKQRYAVTCVWFLLHKCDWDSQNGATDRQEIHSFSSPPPFFFLSANSCSFSYSLSTRCYTLLTRYLLSDLFSQRWAQHF